jgi:hypothetical protein
VAWVLCISVSFVLVRPWSCIGVVLEKCWMEFWCVMTLHFDEIQQYVYASRTSWSWMRSDMKPKYRT